MRFVFLGALSVALVTTDSEVHRGVTAMSSDTTEAAMNCEADTTADAENSLADVSDNAMHTAESIPRCQRSSPDSQLHTYEGQKPMAKASAWHSVIAAAKSSGFVRPKYKIALPYGLKEGVAFRATLGQQQYQQGKDKSTDYPSDRLTALSVWLKPGGLPGSEQGCPRSGSGAVASEHRCHVYMTADQAVPEEELGADGACEDPPPPAPLGSPGNPVMALSPPWADRDPRDGGSLPKALRVLQVTVPSGVQPGGEFHVQLGPYSKAVPIRCPEGNQAGDTLTLSMDGQVQSDGLHPELALD